MKVSELIKQLQAAQAEHGDIYVVVRSMGEGWIENTTVEDLEPDEECPENYEIQEESKFFVINSVM